ncbi:MAG: DEAD/DEAH box helicase [Candidatus Nanoarchaeia archaeon]
MTDKQKREEKTSQNNTTKNITFKGFVLDNFQKKAIASIDKGHSCVVCASTGTGKTLIADYIIDTHLDKDNIIVYTAPIKALSNQKYNDFCKDYGTEKVGLLTGDHAINPTGQVLVMTTEIYRNMLVTNDELIDRVAYVIFDEVHYINDKTRGTIWEESIMFSPKHVRFLALSATIPNYEEFAAWIQTTKDHEVDTVFYGRRPVPLHHQVFDTKLELTTIPEIKKDILREEEYWHSMQVMNPRKKQKMKKAKTISEMKPPHHSQIIPHIKNKLPALYFCFSRKKCEEFAVELARKENFIESKESSEISSYIRKSIDTDIATIQTTRKLRTTLSKGIGFHHSGMLPALKHIVEHLFAKGLIKLLYTTETFSVGINMPAKTVIFHTTEKYDGVSMRMLNAKEYFQIAGRAGRRGIDKEGTVISLINRKFTDLDRLQKISTVDDEPIVSQFSLSTNTVINLLVRFNEEQQEQILKSNFDYYTRTSQGKKAVHIMKSFNNKLKQLKKLNFIEENINKQMQQGGFIDDNQRKYVVTAKGHFARHIYSNEIILTELFFSSVSKKLNDLNLLSVLAAIVYEPRPMDYFMIKGCKKYYDTIMQACKKTILEKEINKTNLKRMINFTRAWATGATFTKLMTYSNMAEGDIIRFFRRLIDTLVQLQRATDDEELRSRLKRLEKQIDRDLVSSI